MAKRTKKLGVDIGKQFSAEYQPAEKWTEKRALELGKELIDWLNEKDEEGEDKGHIFFEEFLIMEKDLYDELIWYLGKKFPSFLRLIEKARRIQEIKLKKYGAGDRLNATITKFVLINNHGWTDRVQTEQKVEVEQKPSIDYSKLTLEQLEQLENLLNIAEGAEPTE